MMTPRQERLLPSGALLVIPALGIGMSSGCISNKEFIQTAASEHVWPAPPERPRVRYVGEISGLLTGANERSRFQEILFGPAPQRRLITPSAVALDASGGRVAIADPNGHCVHVLDLLSNRSIAIETAGPTALEAPIGLAWGGDLLFVSDPPRKVVEVFEFRSLNTHHLRTLSGGNFERPTGLAHDHQRALLYVCDSAKHTLFVVDSAGAVVRAIGAPGDGPGQLRFPVNVAAGGEGTVVVADSMNFRVQQFSQNGQFINAFGRKGDAAGDLALPKGVALDASGNVWVVDAQFENVQAFTTQGALLLALGGEGHGPGEFWLPAGAFIDRQQRLWVADTYNRRVQIFQLMP